MFTVSEPQGPDLKLYFSFLRGHLLESVQMFPVESAKQKEAAFGGFQVLFLSV